MCYILFLWTSLQRVKKSYKIGRQPFWRQSLHHHPSHSPLRHPPTSPGPIRTSCHRLGRGWTCPVVSLPLRGSRGSLASVDRVYSTRGSSWRGSSPSPTVASHPYPRPLEDNNNSLDPPPLLTTDRFESVTYLFLECYPLSRVIQLYSILYSNKVTFKLNSLMVHSVYIYTQRFY